MGQGGCGRTDVLKRPLVAQKCDSAIQRKDAREGEGRRIQDSGDELRSRPGQVVGQYRPVSHQELHSSRTGPIVDEAHFRHEDDADAYEGNRVRLKKVPPGSNSQISYIEGLHRSWQHTEGAQEWSSRDAKEERAEWVLQLILLCHPPWFRVY